MSFGLVYIVSFKERETHTHSITTIVFTLHLTINRTSHVQPHKVIQAMDSKLTVVEGSTAEPAKSLKTAPGKAHALANTQEGASDANTRSAEKKTHISKESMAHLRIR